MESPGRASQTSLLNSGENNESTPLHPEPLNVVPISCFPYTGPPLPDCYHAAASPDINIGSVPVETDSKHTNFQQHAGPLIGSVDIAESEDSYLFRVSLPGVVRNEKLFSCEVGPNGEISIKGVSDTGKNTVRKSRMIFKMQTQNLCPSGEFSVSFQLPGPVDHQNLNCVFGSDGIFEGVVKKNKAVGPLSGI